MATTRAFSIGELIRHLTYDQANDKLTTSKSINTEGKTRKSKATTTTDAQNLDTFAKATYKSALYHVAAHKSTDFHSSLFLIGHDGSTVYVTEYGGLLSGSALYTLDASISGSDVVVQVTPAVTNLDIEFSVEFVNT